MPKLPKAISLLFCIDNSSARESDHIHHYRLEESTGSDICSGFNRGQQRSQGIASSKGSNSHGKLETDGFVVESKSTPTNEPHRSWPFVASQLQHKQPPQQQQQHLQMRQQQYARQQQQQQNRADLNNLYIRNLPPSMSENGLRDFLSTYGTVVSLKILCNEDNSSRGVGFARMISSDECRQIIEELHGRPIGGWKKPLLVEFEDPSKRSQYYGSSKNINCIRNQYDDGLRNNASEPVHNRSNQLQQQLQSQPQGQKRRPKKPRGGIPRSLSVSDVYFIPDASNLEARCESVLGEPVAGCSGAQSQRNHAKHNSGKSNKNNRNEMAGCTNNNNSHRGKGDGQILANGLKQPNPQRFPADKRSHSTQNLTRKGKRMLANFV